MGLAASSLTVDEVMDPHSGALVDARSLIGTDYAALVRLRNEVEEASVAGHAKYVCPVCSAPLLIRCRRRYKSDPRLSKDFHFWHGRNAGDCPLAKAYQMSQEAILAAKYHGQREGQAHIRLKQLIHDSLHCDRRFSGIEQERTWRLDGDPTQWRRPDVSAVFNGQPIVFEIQLSTTFVRVMAERRHFYRQRGALLVWIVAEFNPAWTALAHEDIFYPNNRNIFVASDETLEASRATGSFKLRAHWFEPYSSGDEALAFRFCDQLVAFDQLNRDVSSQRTYYFDTDEAERLLKQNASLRRDFENYWLSEPHGEASEHQWRTLVDRLHRIGIDIPRKSYQLHPLLSSIYSVREGRMIRWHWENLVRLAHHLYVEEKPILASFLQALKTFDRNPTMRNHDTTGRWLKKERECRKQIADGDPQYQPAEYVKPLMDLLFPAMKMETLRGSKTQREAL